MKKLLIIIMILVMLSSLVFAKLSDEVLEDAERLRAKHYGYRRFSDVRSDIKWIPSDMKWIPHINIWFEDSKLFVETQDGNKWYTEMTKIIE